MADLASLVRAGALVPRDAPVPDGERTGLVSARRYVHPALPDRPVVRLVPDPIAAGVDAEMELLGFAAPEVRPALGRQRYRALGFPGWALVHDPARARFALDVMRDFKKAAARVASKPGHARDGFLEIADRLARSVPHFLPSFWEEAGRAFLAEDTTSFAAQAFEKARAAEKEHRLAVDEDLRSSVYLEFALAGAVAAKSFSGYAAELARSYGAEEAYARFRELAVRRTLGGLPPWSGMARDLRALARSAGLDLDAEDVRLVEELLEAPTIARAPGDFWAAYRPAVVALARREARVRRRLRQLFPKPTAGTQGFEAEWLSLLDEAGALAALEADDGEEPAGAAAAFLQKLLDFVAGRREALPLLERLADRVRADAVPLEVERKQHWRGLLDLHVVERALELGLPLAAPSEREAPRWSGAVTVRPQFVLEGPLVDPVLLARDPRFAPCLVESVAHVVGTAAFEAEAAGKGGFLEARRAWLDGRVEALERGALPGLAAAIQELEQRTGPGMFAEQPAIYARLTEVSVARALATSLRGGLLAELAWPAFEEAAAAIGPGCQVGGVFPYPVLTDSRRRAIVVGGEGRVLDHSLALPKGASAQSLAFVDGQLFVAFWDPQAGLRGYWSGDPAATFAVANYLPHHGTDLMTQAPVEGGGATLGGRVVRAGDPAVTGTARVVSDGTTCWTMVWHEGRHRLVEIDPRSDRQGRPSWPSFAREASERDDGKRITDVFLLPLPRGAEGTPLGTRDGLIGHHVRSLAASYDFTGVDGRARSAPYPIEGLVTLPGGDERPRAVAGTRRYGQGGAVRAVELRDPDGTLLGALGSQPWDHRPFQVVPPVSCWHFLRPRDEAGSQALRAVDEALAARLLAGEPTVTVPAELGAIGESVLREAVIEQVKEAGRLEEQLRKLVAARDPASGRIDEGAIPGSQLVAALGPLLGHGYGSTPINSELRAAARALAFEDAGTFVPSGLTWQLALGQLRGVAVYALSTSLAPAARATARRFLRALRGEPSLTEELERLRVFRAHVEPGSPLVGPAQSPFGLTVGAHNAYFASVLQGGVRLVVERTRDGTFRLPPGATLLDETRPGAGDQAFLDAFLAREEVPEPDAEAVAVLAERTGLTRAEAAIVLGGVPRLGIWESDFLGKEARERLGLKVAEAKVAKESLRGLGADVWRRVFDEAGRVDDAGVLFDARGLAERLAAGWNAVVGRRLALREELVVACEKELDPPAKTTLVLGALLDPAGSPLLAIREVPFDALFVWQAPDDRLSAQSLVSFCLLLPWLYATLPVGDAYRAALPALHEALLARLADPALLLPVGTVYADDKASAQNRALFCALDGTERPVVVDSRGNTAEGRDGGGLVMAILRKDGYLMAAFRPARLDADDDLAWRVSALGHAPSAALGAVRLLRSPGFASMMARVRSTPVPVGGYEADPRASAAALVAEVGARHGLDADAAALYLQTLALAEPTQRNVLRWNGWKAPVYKKAAAALLAAGLVVEGKRERAGRELFLPGAWDKGQGKALPMERWKQPLYALERGTLPRPVPLVPLHELFAAASARVAAGDVPRLEEV